MNNEQRKELKIVRSGLEKYRDKLTAIMDNEQMKFDNLSEGLQATMRGSAMEEAIENMNLAIEAIDEAIEYIDEAAI